MAQEDRSRDWYSIEQRQAEEIGAKRKKRLKDSLTGKDARSCILISILIV